MRVRERVRVAIENPLGPSRCSTRAGNSSVPLAGASSRILEWAVSIEARVV